MSSYGYSVKLNNQQLDIVFNELNVRKRALELLLECDMSDALRRFFEKDLADIKSVITHIDTSVKKEISTKNAKRGF